MSDLLVVLSHYGHDSINPSRLTGKTKCPVHDERRASCSYDLNQGVMNCFACDFAGDAISLIMAKENVDAATAKRRYESIVGEGYRAVRAEPERRSPISGGKGYQPKFRRSVPARRRNVFGD